MIDSHLPADRIIWALKTLTNVADDEACYTHVQEKRNLFFKGDPSGVTVTWLAQFWKELQKNLLSDP